MFRQRHMFLNSSTAVLTTATVTTLALAWSSPAHPGTCPPPAPAAKESESCGGNTNDGCSYLSHPTEPIDAGVPLVGTFWVNGDARDVDFFRFVLTQPARVTAHLWATEFTQFALIDACTVVDSNVGTCLDVQACLPPGVYNVFVAPLKSAPICGAASSTYTVLLELAPADPACVPLTGDLDRSGTVDGIDLSLLVDHWGEVDPGSCDLNGDQRVDGLDLGMLLGAWRP
jgi:hypothetical protein